MRCPKCSREVKPPGRAYIIEGEHRFKCPKGHAVVVTTTITPRAGRPERA